MVNNRKENKKIHWKNFEETNSKDISGSANWTSAAEIASHGCPLIGLPDYIKRQIEQEIELCIGNIAIKESWMRKQKS